MFDHTSGQLRPNMVIGIHYAPVGLKVFAKEIKRSLYGRHESIQRNMRPSLPRVNAGVGLQFPRPATSLRNGNLARDPRQEIQNFLSMAISRLGTL